MYRIFLFICLCHLEGFFILHSYVIKGLINYCRWHLYGARCRSYINLRPAGTFLSPTSSQWSPGFSFSQMIGRWLAYEKSTKTIYITQQMTIHLHERKCSSHKFHHHFSNSVISMGSTPSCPQSNAHQNEKETFKTLQASVSGYPNT